MVDGKLRTVFASKDTTIPSKQSEKIRPDNPWEVEAQQ